MNQNDIDFARAALDAAAQGAGVASPNPLVGTIIVRDGEVVGRGWHVYADRRHAEAVALEDAGERARGATVYVNLEPCSHFGRTPPCADALVEAGVSRVVASMQDPAPFVNGRGFARLREAGIEVEVGIEREAAERLNERYVRYITTGRPFVLLKAAMTLDGRVATHSGRSKWITGTAAREASQELRRIYDAILVGVTTATVDNPELTYRGQGARGAPLLRAVVDPGLRLPPECRLVETVDRAPLVIYTRQFEGDDVERAAALASRGVEVVPVKAGAGRRLDLADILADLGRRRIGGLIVEGGPETSAAFLADRLVDKVTFFVAPKLLGGRGSLGVIGGNNPETLDGALALRDVEVTKAGDDLVVTAYPWWGAGDGG